MSFYCRAWIRGTTIYTLHTNTHPIVLNTFDGWSDLVIDFEIVGEYQLAGEVLPHLVFANGEITSSQYTIVQTLVAPGRQDNKVVEVQAQRETLRLSFAQLLIGLVTENWITEAEGRAWLKGDVPALVETMIEALPEESRFAAYAKAVTPSVVERTDPLVIALGQVAYKSPEELDDFFATYSV